MLINNKIGVIKSNRSSVFSKAADTPPVTDQTPKPDNSDEIIKRLELLEQSNKTLEAENKKLVGINKEAFEQRDKLKAKFREIIEPGKKPEPDGKVNENPDIASLQNTVKDLAGIIEELKSDKAKKVDTLEAELKANMEAVPENKREQIDGIMKFLEGQSVESRIAMFNSVKPLVLGEQPITVDSLNLPKGGKTVNLTAQEEAIAKRQGWSYDKAAGFKSEDPNFFAKAIKNLEKN